jgi:dTDP-4-dehydrorhamnose reductase
MKLLMTGKMGQLGEELQTVLPTVGEIVAVGRHELDLTDGDRIRELVTTVKPDVVVNAAAYTAVDKAENEPDLAMSVNGTGVGGLAQVCDEIGARFIHLSTDYVFDGRQSHPYGETDPTHPLGSYGKSKLAGETAIREIGGDAIILRTAWVYGVGGTGNFVKTMLRLGGDREQLRVVCDQVGSPTWTGDLAGAIAAIVRQQIPAGTYHYTNSGVASWYDFAIAIFEEAQTLGFPLKVRSVTPITTADYPTPAKRPAYSVLSNQKITSALGTYPPHWRQGLRQMLKNFAVFGNKVQ